MNVFESESQPTQSTEEERDKLKKRVALLESAMFDAIEALSMLGYEVDYDDAAMCALALDSLLTFSNSDVHALAQSVAKVTRSLYLEENFRRNKQAFARTPREWLGDNVAENKNYQRRRRVAHAILRKVKEGS